MSAAEVQANRLNAAQQLAEQFDCVAVLKGSGTVIAHQGTRQPSTPPATHGSPRLAQAMCWRAWWVRTWQPKAEAQPAASQAVYQQGLAADRWPAGRQLTASALARHITQI